MNSVGKFWAAAVAAGAAAAAAGLARSQYERDHFVVEETVISSPKIRKPKTLVFLSDLHDKEFGRRNERLLASISHIAPDMILIGGDVMVTKPGKARLDVTKRLLDGLCEIRSRIAGAGTGEPCRIYYGNGNHEQRMKRETGEYGTLYREFLELLSGHEIAYLSDSYAEPYEDIRISGLDIDREYYRDFVPRKMKPEYLRKRIGTPGADRFQILLAHSPLFFDAYAAWGADLTLAGHFHGGTIRLPWLGGVMTPQYQFFLPLCAGNFERDGRKMIVSRGLGTHSVNIRFCNRPQVVVVKLIP